MFYVLRPVVSVLNVPSRETSLRCCTVRLPNRVRLFRPVSVFKTVRGVGYAGVKLTNLLTQTEDARTAVKRIIASISLNVQRNLHFFSRRPIFFRPAAFLFHPSQSLLAGRIDENNTITQTVPSGLDEQGRIENYRLDRIVTGRFVDRTSHFLAYARMQYCV